MSGSLTSPSLDRPIPEWALKEAVCLPGARMQFALGLGFLVADERVARALADAYERGQVEMRERASAVVSRIDAEAGGAIRELAVKP